MEMFQPERKRQTVKIKKDSFEVAAWQQGQVVCGIDEVGRGCLAGSVVTAAVILPPGKKSPLLKDSKILTPDQRQKAAQWIMTHCWYGYGVASHRAIDRHNIYQATLLAMKRALVNLVASSPTLPSAILIDAMPLKLHDTAFANIPVHHFIKGESKSSSVAAASILAKVKRDAILTQLEFVFPGYHLGQHKGYSTATHIQAVLKLEKSIIHRNSFLTKIYAPPGANQQQQGLFDQEEPILPIINLENHE